MVAALQPGLSTGEGMTADLRATIAHSREAMSDLSENLEALFIRLHRLLDPFPERSEIILVDDCSSDDSLEIMRSLRSRDWRVRR